MGDRIKQEMPGFKGELLYPEHHQSHAASAFLASPFERAAILTLDGVGEWATASWGVGAENRVELKREMHFPHSLGLLYSAFTYYTGFRVNSGEYKLMGLAPYGEPKYVQTIRDNLLDLKEDGSFRLNLKYFNYCQGLTMTSRRFHKLFGGPPREPESELTQKEMDLARSVQDVTEDIMLKMARHVKKETDDNYLCLAGGVSLNCVGNGQILRSGIFDDIWIQPAAGDAGGALGAALFTWHIHLNQAREFNEIDRDLQKGSYLGPSWTTDQIEAWLRKRDYPYHRHDTETTISKTVEALESEKVVGWFSGRMEFGPRALGGRSIIGDARSSKMQSTMNLKVKYRESFRPFAPSVLVEDVDRYFELDRPSPYMLIVAPVKPKRRKQMTSEQNNLFGIAKLNIPRSDIPAVTHVDYSARVQTVDKRDNPRYHQLISKFKERTGCSVIVNTSFNVRGEPIVCTPQDAYLCFMRTEIDVLVMEDLILHKHEQPPLEEKVDWRELFDLD
jgi:carbamoyltransferase